MTNIEKAKALIGTFNSGDLALADSLLAPKYTQHNLAFADGRDAFIAAVAGLQQAPVKTTVNVIREFEDGDFVALQVVYSFAGAGDNGLIDYNGGYHGRVIKVGQKNFGIEDVREQNIDIEYLANALKLLDGTQSADIVKIDRPVTLDKFSGDLFEKLTAVRESFEDESIKQIKQDILKERIDAIDKMNNVRKQYISDYYIVLYGKNELDLENLAINVASEINKCGLTVYYDLFRVENGFIAEHWDVMEETMPKEKWANQNGKF